MSIEIEVPRLFVRRLNLTKLKEAVDRYSCQMVLFGEAVAGRPVPPMPRRYYAGTAREYRAARRRYRRQCDARKKVSNA